MDDFMIATWNKVVHENDTVYYLGDFALAPKVRKKEILSELNGYKVAIRGNHDAGPLHMREIGFDEVYSWLILKLERAELLDKKLLLIHDVNGFLRKAGPKNVFDYILCGHVHSNWKKRQNAVNVGVDQWAFKPISLPTALAVFNLDLSDKWNLRVEREPRWKGATAPDEIYSL